MRTLINNAMQMDGNLQHYVYGLNPMLNWLAENDIDAGPYLRKANIDPKRLSMAGETIFPAQEIGFINQVYKDLQIPDLGLHIGPNFKLAYFGLLGLSVLTSENLYQAFKVIFEHSELTWSYCQLSVSVEGELAYFEFEPVRDLGESLLMMLDRDMSGTLKISSDALGFPLPVDRLELCHASTSYEAHYQKVFACPIVFNAAKNRIVFAKKYLQMALPNADSKVSQIYLQQCLQDSQRLMAKQSLAEQVRSLLMSNWQQGCSLEMLARQLNMTSRTLQRKLAAQGTSYTALLKEVRLNLAKEYLLTSQLTLDEISERLAFHDKAAFSNAFKGWTGSAPSHYRQGAKNRA